ncbi:MAG: quinolinate synthase, partial [Saprospiraceae bacterium]
MTHLAFDVPSHINNKLAPSDNLEYKTRIKALLKAEDAVLVAHYYTDEAIQELAEET